MLCLMPPQKHQPKYAIYIESYDYELYDTQKPYVSHLYGV